MSIHSMLLGCSRSIIILHTEEWPVCLLCQRKRRAWLLTIHIVWPSNSVLLRFTLFALFYSVDSTDYFVVFCFVSIFFLILLIFFTFPLFSLFFIFDLIYCCCWLQLIGKFSFFFVFIHLFEMVGNGWRAQWSHILGWKLESTIYS